MVLQENQLFSGTLLDNITLGDPKPDFDRAVQAAKAADAHEFILRQPKGYSTPIFEGGTNISGGQRQRINIARALYRTPRVLILDEDTAALDSATEQVIVRNIKAMAGNITTLIVAHRLNTIMYADRIVVVSDGEVLEMGTHKELLDNGGWYAQRVRRQSM